jgi:ABC-type polysaccharide transport system permease subunit
MAASFTILGTVPTVELVGSNQTRQVRQITAQALPSQITFSFIVVPGDFIPSHVSLIASTIAAALNARAQVPGVVDINVYQDVNGSGQFVNKAAVTVESTSGNSVVEVQIPYGDIFDAAAFTKAVRATRATLDEIDNL